MNQVPRLRKSDLDVLIELLQVLHGTLDMQQALRAAYPLLGKLVPADHGALCVSRADNPMLYDWTVADMPDGFFQGYAEVAEHDFVRAAVGQTPNIVVRDHEMVADPTNIERHPLVEYSRSKGMRIEQIMAVMLSSEPSWHGGLTLYRDKRRPFSEHERAILQFLTPHFSTAVANCKRFGDVVQWSAILETSLSLHRTSVLVFSPTLQLVAGSNGVYQLLDRCFGPKDRGRDGLPTALLDELALRASNILPAAAPLPPWIPPMGKPKRESKRGAGLAVTFIPVVRNSKVYWLVLLDEIPAEWRELLTPTEIDVAVRVAQGWDNEMVADDIGNEVPTTKTHLFRVFEKLGVDNRGMLQARFRARGQ